MQEKNSECFFLNTVYTTFVNFISLIELSIVGE